MTNDVSDTTKGFEDQVKKMLDKLENEHKFSIPQLSLNMRNSSTIGSCAKGVKQIFYTLNDPTMKENVVAKLPTPETSVTSNLPLLIPIQKNEFDNKFGTALKEVLTSFENKCIILHSNSFKSAVIKKVLVNECNIKDNIVCHDEYPNNSSRTDLESFLSQPKDKLGVFQAKFVTGMESCNLCLLLDDNNYKESVRCFLTRAVSDLKIILRISDNPDIFRFGNARLDPKHLKCQQTKETSFAFKCNTCSIDVLCKYCHYGCHHGHSVEQFEHVIRSRCWCDKKYCNIK